MIKYSELAVGDFAIDSKGNRYEIAEIFEDRVRLTNGKSMPKSKVTAIEPKDELSELPLDPEQIELCLAIFRDAVAWQDRNHFYAHAQGLSDPQKKQVWAVMADELKQAIHRLLREPMVDDYVILGSHANYENYLSQRLSQIPGEIDRLNLELEDHDLTPKERRKLSNERSELFEEQKAIRGELEITADIRWMADFYRIQSITGGFATIRSIQSPKFTKFLPLNCLVGCTPELIQQAQAIESSGMVAA